MKKKNRWTDEAIENCTNETTKNELALIRWNPIQERRNSKNKQHGSLQRITLACHGLKELTGSMLMKPQNQTTKEDPWRDSKKKTKEKEEDTIRKPRTVIPSQNDNVHSHLQHPIPLCDTDCSIGLKESIGRSPKNCTGHLLFLLLQAIREHSRSLPSLLLQVEKPNTFTTPSTPKVSFAPSTI